MNIINHIIKNAEKFSQFFFQRRPIRISVNNKLYMPLATKRLKLIQYIIEGWTFLQQNPNKKSEYGKRARQGHKIIWVINPKGQYIGRIEDGKFYNK